MQYLTVTALAWAVNGPTNPILVQNKNIMSVKEYMNIYLGNSWSRELSDRDHLMIKKLEKLLRSFKTYSLNK